LCDKIFGEENFVNDFMWLVGKGKKDAWSRTLEQHTLCFAKNKKCLKPFCQIEYSNWAKSNADGDPRGNWFSGSISFSENRSNKKHKNFYRITSPGGVVWERQWLVSKEEMDKLLQEDKIYFGKAPKYDGVPRAKIFNDSESYIIPKNIIDFVETTKQAQNYVDSLLGQKNVFDNPKPVSLIKHFIQISQMPKDAVILDFFAGSGTTFEAVCQLNHEDSGDRHCILIQKDEKTSKTTNFDTISKLSFARCQKVQEIYNEPIEFFEQC
jgi:adenine-specific DNA-methyltransferase